MTENKLKIGLIGYGKMGKTIEKIALEKSHTILLKTNRNNPLQNNLELLSELDVAIEFSAPDIAVQHLKILGDYKVPTICGSTAWLEQYDEIKSIFEQNGTAFMYASNFSIGVNIFFELNKSLAKMMNAFPDYQVKMMEAHHTQKKDAPSGTAVTLAEQIISNRENYIAWSLDSTNKDDVIPIQAIREADVKGTHEITYFNSIDLITIRHEAFTREGFAQGALMAAEWIWDKHGIYEFRDMMKFN